MDAMRETEKTFINTFSNSDMAHYGLPSRIDLPIYDKFLTNEIGIKYIGNMLKDIDIRLYLAYLKMLKDKIKFIDNYDIEKSVCISDVYGGVTKDVEVNVPCIRNGMDIFATSHELGHGIKSFTKINNERYLHSNTMYNETISILFGKLCLERYINDFGFDVYAQQFDILNIKKATTKAIITNANKKPSKNEFFALLCIGFAILKSPLFYFFLYIKITILPKFYRMLYK